MQGRSWMAALTLLAASAGLTLSSMVAPQAAAAGPPPARQKVQLLINVNGIAAGSGVEVIIRPGNPSCRFKEVTYAVRREGAIRDIPPIEVETVNADRDCAFAIILKEPGQPDRIVRRSLLINQAALAADPDKPQVLQCYLNSRTMVLKDPASPPNPASPATPTPIATKPAPATTRKR